MPKGFSRSSAPTPASGTVSIGGTFSIFKNWTHSARRRSHGASRCTDYSRPATSIWRRRSRWRRLRGGHWRSQTEAANPLGAKPSDRNHRGCRNFGHRLGHSAGVFEASEKHQRRLYPRLMCCALRTQLRSRAKLVFNAQRAAPLSIRLVLTTTAYGRERQKRPFACVRDEVQLPPIFLARRS